MSGHRRRARRNPPPNIPTIRASGFARLAWRNLIWHFIKSAGILATSRILIPDDSGASGRSSVPLPGVGKARQTRSSRSRTSAGISGSAEATPRLLSPIIHETAIGRPRRLSRNFGSRTA